MALASALISYDISDMVGADFDARRTKVWVTTNVDSNTVVDTVGNQIRIGDGLGTIADDGTGSVSVWVPGAGSNPASWQTYVHVDHSDRRPAGVGGKREVRTFGPFTVTGDANLADLIVEQEVPPTYLSTVVAELDGYVGEAQAAQAAAEAAAAAAVDISGISTSDGTVEALVKGTAGAGSLTRAALAATVVPVGQGSARLTNWIRKIRNDVVNAVIALSGDSTMAATGPTAAAYARIGGVQFQGVSIPAYRHTAPGEGLAGMVEDAAHFLDYGNTGMSLQTLLANYDANDTGPRSLRALITAAPHLIVFSWGINDVRLGATTKAQLIVRIRRAVDILRAALPNTDIVLRIPNSLSTTNYNSLNYVQGAPGDGSNINPAGAAQAYSTLMREAYLALSDAWPNVVVADTQAAVFGTKSVARTSAGLLGDQLHPGQAGQYAWVDWLVKNFIGYYPQAQRTSDASVSAVAVSQFAPWTADAGVLDDTTRFVLIADSPYVTQGSGYIRFSYNPVGNIAKGDIVRLSDDTAFTVTAQPSQLGGATSPTADLTQTIPTNAQTSGKVRIYRQVASGDANWNNALADTSVRFKRVGRIVAGGTNTLTIEARPIAAARTTQPASEWPTLNMTTSDKVYVEGLGSAPEAAASFVASGINVVISGLAGGVDYSTYIGRLALITGTHNDSLPGAAGPAGPATGPATAFLPGRDSLPNVSGSPTGTNTVNGTEYAVPFVPVANGTLDKLGIEVSTLAAGAVARLGIRSSLNGFPDSVVLDAGTVDCSTTGYKQIAGLSQSLVAGTVYWLSVRVAGGTPGVKTLTGISPYVTMRDGVGNEAGAGGYSAARTTTDAALGAWGATFTPTNVAVMVRAHAA